MAFLPFAAIERIERGVSVGLHSHHTPVVRHCRDIDVVLFSVEVDDRDLIELSDGLPDDGIDDLPDNLLVFEFDFRLCGVDIDIDVLRIDMQVDEVVGVLSLGNDVIVCPFYSRMEILMLHEPSVNEKELLCTFPFRILRLSHESSDTDKRGFRLHRQERVGEPCTINICYPLLQIGLGEPEYRRVIVGEEKFQFGIDEHDSFKVLHDVVEFRLRFF